MTDVPNMLEVKSISWYRAVSVFVVLVVGLSSCSNSSTEKESNTSLPRGVTTQEAQLLSQALVGNAQDKNAMFEASSGSFRTGGFIADGVVNWKDSVVRIDVSLYDEKNTDLSAVITADGVFESFEDLHPALSQAGLNIKDWIFRPANTEKYGIDALAQFITKLASLTPDNPILLKQNGAQFLGDEVVDGIKTAKFQNTEAVTYFLTDQGELKKVTARIKGFENEISMTFSKRKTSQVDVPDLTSTYSLKEVEGFYSRIRPPF